MKLKILYYIGWIQKSIEKNKIFYLIKKIVGERSKFRWEKSEERLSSGCGLPDFWFMFPNS